MRRIQKTYIVRDLGRVHYKNKVANERRNSVFCIGDKSWFNSTGANFATVQNAVLEISLHGKLELFHKDFLECRDIILLTENQHGFLVIDGFYTTERKRTISVRYQHRIGG